MNYLAKEGVKFRKTVDLLKEARAEIILADKLEAAAASTLKKLAEDNTRLLDALGAAEASTIHAKWVSAMKALEVAEKDNIRLLEVIADVTAVRFATHSSWNCNEEFDRGWRECRKQVDEALNRRDEDDLL